MKPSMKIILNHKNIELHLIKDKVFNRTITEYKKTNSNLVMKKKITFNLLL